MLVDEIAARNTLKPRKPDLSLNSVLVIGDSAAEFLEIGV